MTPVPRSIGQWHDEAVRIVPGLESVLKPGDVIFRLSNTELAGGLVDFSKTIAECTESQMSHASLVRHVGPDGVIVADVTPAGVARRYLVDWWLDGTRNLVVCRLKPEYAYLIPEVLAELDRLIAADVMYDDKFSPDNDRYYCTELVDHCFRATGHPLAPLIRIRDFPRNNLVFMIGCLVGGISTNNPVAIAGNERIGLFSSPMLETVVDLRGKSTTEIERLLPRTVLVDRRAAPAEDRLAPGAAPGPGKPAGGG
ncbi:MAG: hypothetical protein HRF43_11735 [Phycisphaerae bacterium]|jgi:hypothetical protein